MSLLFISVILGGDRIAIVTKVIGSVNYTRGNDASKSLKKGHIFESGDVIRTEKGGFAALIFIDDKSALITSVITPPSLGAATCASGDAFNNCAIACDCEA